MTTGRTSLLEELREQVPPGLVEMLQISGTRRRQDPARSTRRSASTRSPELEAAARDGRLAGLPRFGRRRRRTSSRASRFLRQASGFRLSHHALEEARGAARRARAACPASSRRSSRATCAAASEVVREIVMVLVADTAPAEVFAPAEPAAGRERVRGSGRAPRHAALRGRHHGAGRSSRRRSTLGAVLVQATGSEAHLRQLAAHARELGFSLDGAALWRGSEFVPTPDEADALRARSACRVIPPELREGRDEIALAAAGRCRACSSAATCSASCTATPNYSDGTNTVRGAGRARAARAGYRYVGITDHSQAAAYAGGLTADDLDAPVGRDRRGERAARGHPRPQGHRGRHPPGRRARLSGDRCSSGSTSSSARSTVAST